MSTPETASEDSRARTVRARQANEQLGHLVVHSGLVTPEQLASCSAEIEQAPRTQQLFWLGQVLLKRELLTIDQFLELMEQIHDDIPAVRPHETTQLVAPPRPTLLPPPDLDAPPISGPGRYELLTELGRGGMATVHVAWDYVLERRVALKLLRGANTEPLQRRLRREARVVARLNHPNIVTVHDFGQYRAAAAGQPPVFYISMAFLTGGTLRQAMTRDTPSDELLTLLGQAASGVGHAHRHGVVHRDLKPANILISDDRRAVVADFGLARWELDTMLTRTGELLGTARYMAPEQARGEIRSLDARTDVWALGVILYELLARVPPFKGEIYLDVLQQVLQGAAPPPSTHDARICPELDAICMRALQPQREDRYSDGLAFAAALDDWRCAQAGGRTRAATGARGARRWIFAAGLVLLALAAWWAGSRWRAASAGKRAERATQLRRELQTYHRLLAARTGQLDTLAGSAGALQEAVARLQRRDSKRPGHAAVPAATRAALADWKRLDRSARAAISAAQRLASDARESEASRRLKTIQPETLVALADRLASALARTRHALAAPQKQDRPATTSASWRLRSSTTLRTCLALAFSRRGKLLLASGGRTPYLRLRDIDARRALATTFQGHTARIQSLAFNPNAPYLVTGSTDGTVCIWDGPSGRRLARGKGHAGEVRAVDWSPDPRLVASGGADGSVRIWSASGCRSRHILRKHTSPVNLVAFSPSDSSWLLSGSTDGMLCIWSAERGRLMRTLRLSDASCPTATCLAATSGSARVATGHQDGRLTLWTIKGEPQTLRRFQAHPRMTSAVAFSPGGRFLASGGHGGLVRIWEVPSGRLLQTLEGHTAAIRSLAFSPDGRLLASGGFDRGVRVWERR